MPQWDAYRQALLNSLYQDVTEVQETQKNRGYAQRAVRGALNQVLAPTAATPSSFGPAATLGSSYAPSSTVTPSLMTASEIGASTAPSIAAPVLGSGTGVAAGLTTSVAPSLMTAGEIGAVGTASAGTAAAAGSTGATTAGEAATTATGSSGVGIPIALGLAVGSATPNSPLFGLKKFMYKPLSQVYKYTGGALLDKAFGRWSPQGVVNQIFGDPYEQEREYKDMQRKSGLAAAFGQLNKNKTPGRAYDENPEPQYYE